MEKEGKVKIIQAAQNLRVRARFKVSVYCTVKNEEMSVQELLKSMLNQSTLPDEIVIVDGGSRDETTKVLEVYQKDHPSLIKIILAPGANIAEGRNIAIKEAKYDLIASTDAGVEYDKNWLRNLCHWFKEDPTVDIVSGFFKPKAETSYEQCVSILLYPNLDLIKWDKFLPSARSVAFRKKVWEEIGGFAEWLPRGVGEDSHFFLRAKKEGYNFAYAKDAICYWRPRKNLAELFKQYFFYSMGATIGGVSIFLSQAYGANPIYFTIKNLSGILQKRKIDYFVLSLIILTTVLLAKITGTITGIIQKIFIIRGKKK